jgi:hypothetical protein
MDAPTPRSRRAPLITILTALVIAVPLAPAAQAVQTSESVVVSADPADWTPNILDGQVNTILQMGSKVVVGGTFTQVRRAGFSQIFTRNYLFAFDMDTGVIDPNFVPALNAEVEQLAPGPDGTSIFAGGDFSTVNGQSYKKVVRLNLADGSIATSFKANTNGLVQDLVLRDGWLYVSGKFTLIKSTARSGVARLNAITGSVDPNFDLPFTNPPRGSMGVPEIDVTPDGSKLIALGSFGQVAGQPRIQIAMLDLSTTPATVSPWQTSVYPVYDPNNPTTTWCSGAFQTYMRDVDIAPDGSYFIVVTTGAFRANRMCDTISRWELNTTGPNQQPTWVNWTGGDTSWSVSVSGVAVYVGGHMRWNNNPYRGDTAGPGAVAREGIMALSPLNGMPFSWNPTHERGVGSFTLPVTPDGLWVGSDTDHSGGEFHQKISFFPAEGGVEPPPVVTYALPNDLYNLETAGVGAMNRRGYDLTTLGASSTVPLGIDWRNARGAFMLNGNLYYGWSDGWLYKRTFDGTAVGAQAQVPLYGLEVQPSSSFVIPGTTTRVPPFALGSSSDIANMTSMFYDNGRIYYTVAKTGTASANNNKLYYRYFNPESEIVGANLFVASTGGEGINWGNVRGMTLASGKLIFALSDGRLYRADWDGSKPTGSVTQISSATTWQSRGMFVFDQGADTFAPSKPGTPTGASSTFDSIDLSWQASTDSVSSTLTYRIYRDGVVIDQVMSASAGSVSYTDTGLAAGSTHTYQVDAVDEASNASVLSDASASITVLAPDTTPPSDPGIPTGTSSSTSTIDLSWTAATDDESTSLTYRVFRDGTDPADQIAEFESASTGSIAYTDPGLWPGSAHTYAVQAVDGSGNEGNLVSSDPIVVMPAVFADDFAGGLTAWSTVTRLSLDVASGSGSAPSARGNPSAQSAFAYANLSTPLSTVCVSANMNITNRTTALDLIRLRTATNGAIAKVYLDSQGRLIVRSDFASTQQSSGIALPTGWNRIELCGSAVDASGAWTLYLNGAVIVGDWQANTGQVPVGRIQIGDTGAKTWTANWDDVLVDLAAG